jgi:GNAT superfamily N-acetyltransferase
MEVTRVDPLTLDLELADRIAAVDAASVAEAGLEVPAAPGPSRLVQLQHANEGQPIDGLWLARDGDEVAGWVIADLPHHENLDLAGVRGTVHPAYRRRGLGTRLLDAALAFVSEQGRTSVHSGAYAGSDGVGFLEAQGFSTDGQHPYAIRVLDLHAGRTWDRLYDEAAPAANDYELLHTVGPTPDELVDGLVGLYDAMNDAPADDGSEPMTWSADRIRTYDEQMARRRETVHRVLARHVPSGDLAGMSVVCVDEFAPSVAFQEDTSVVRTHRGHRLGLLMKTDMLRRLGEQRPEISSVLTWNAVDNHHMIAVNERLGCRVVAQHVGYRRTL